MKQIVIYRYCGGPELAVGPVFSDNGLTQLIGQVSAAPGCEFVKALRINSKADFTAWTKKTTSK